SPRGNAVTTGGIPTFSRFIGRLTQPKVTRIQQLKPILFVENSRMFSFLFTIISSASSKTILAQSSYILQLMTVTFLGSKDIKVVISYQCVHPLVHVRPSVTTRI